MLTDRSKRLRRIVDLARMREQDAAEKLVRSNEEQSACEAQLRELETCRVDYLREFRSAGGEGMSAGRVHDFRRFMNGLDKAITQLSRRLDQQRQVGHSYRENWLGTHNKVSALQEITDGAEAKERRAFSFQQQLEIEDRFNRPQKESF